MFDKKEKLEQRYLILSFYAVFVLISSFFFNSPSEIFEGMKLIITSPSVVLTDYMELANIGSALFNSGLMMLIVLTILKINKAEIVGPILAAFFTIAGFSLLGKNIYNFWSIFLGVYLYSRYQDDNFKKHLVVALFSSCLGPLVSQVSFGFNLPPLLAILLGNLSGLIVGFIMPTIANHSVGFHNGFNIYNVGFAAGIIGTFFMSIFRSYGLENDSPAIISQGNNLVFSIYFSMFFLSMIIIGWFLNDKSFKGYSELLTSSGRLVSDFASRYGFAVSFINMGSLGLVGISYVLLVSGQLNGPTLGAILTVSGFGAFGKHIKNTLPLIFGVFLASLFNVWDLASEAVILAALAGTTLAPITGVFGVLAGILAGILHSSIVMNIGYLHGGMDLYNNGFSGGLVAGLLVPILISFRKDSDSSEVQ